LCLQKALVKKFETAETLPQQSRLQSISEHIATHLAIKTKPVTKYIKIDYRGSPVQTCRSEHCVTPFIGRDLLESKQESKVRTIVPATQNVPCKETIGDNYPVEKHFKTY
jgi:hypothetical protein